MPCQQFLHAVMLIFLQLILKYLYLLLLSPTLSLSHQYSLEQSVFIEHTKEASPRRTDISAVIRQLVDISLIPKRTLDL